MIFNHTASSRILKQALAATDHQELAAHWKRFMAAVKKNKHAHMLFDSPELQEAIKHHKLPEKAIQEMRNIFKELCSLGFESNLDDASINSLEEFLDIECGRYQSSSGPVISRFKAISAALISFFKRGLYDRAVTDYVVCDQNAHPLGVSIPGFTQWNTAEQQRLAVDKNSVEHSYYILLMNLSTSKDNNQMAIAKHLGTMSNLPFAQGDSATVDELKRHISKIFDYIQSNYYEPLCVYLSSTEQLQLQNEVINFKKGSRRASLIKIFCRSTTAQNRTWYLDELSDKMGNTTMSMQDFKEQLEDDLKGINKRIFKLTGIDNFICMISETYRVNPKLTQVQLS